SCHLDASGSRWIRDGFFEESPDPRAPALLRASRIWPSQLHANKGLSGATPATLDRERSTSINPAAFDAGALLIAASAQEHAFPGVPGREPDHALGAAHARRAGEAVVPVRSATPSAGG